MHDQPPKHKKPATPLEKLREEAETGQFASRLVKDFRFSFRYSLGSERGHELILNLLGFQYFQGGEIVQHAVNEELPLIEESEWRAAATPPKEHKTLKQDHFVRESEHEWNKFQTIVAPDRIAQLVEGMRNGEIDHYGDIVLQLAHHMIKKDQKYMTRGYGIKSGRPERSSPKKRYASFTREYVLARSSSGSPTFNAIFEDMRQVILSCPPVEIGRLASMWRDCNNDREFYPPDFLIAAKAEGTQDQFDYLPLLYNDEWEHGGRRLFLPYGERR